ncbi:MAG: GntR family transcriptional regulator [Anaerolineales bacterium]|jgi:DNA-binding GntR family transcriptional regulator
MDLIRIDTRKAYENIREKITTLELKPGSVLDDQALAVEIGLELKPVREALTLLAHDGLVTFSDQGMYVADINVSDLEQLSELRLQLETFCARLAAERASPDDLAVLEALRSEQATISPDEMDRLFDLDHKFHQAIAAASGNRYLTRALEQLFGQSQRLWYLVLPELDFLPGAVETHLDLLKAIKAGDGDRAALIMREHVKGFYDKVKTILLTDKD